MIDQSFNLKFLLYCNRKQEYFVYKTLNEVTFAHFYYYVNLHFFNILINLKLLTVMSSFDNILNNGLYNRLPIIKTLKSDIPGYLYFTFNIKVFSRERERALIENKSIFCSLSYTIAHQVAH